MEVVMPKSQRRLAVTLFVFVMFGVLGAGLALAAEPLQVTPAQPIVEPNPVPLWLGGIAEVCYDGFNGCAPAPGPCCWRCPGGSASWSCAPASSANACKSLCVSHCGTTCGWI
jgi:hypothetical protein